MLGSFVEGTYIHIDAYKFLAMLDERDKTTNELKRERRSVVESRARISSRTTAVRESKREREISSREQQPRNLLVGEDRVKTGVAGVDDSVFRLTLAGPQGT